MILTQEKCCTILRNLFECSPVKAKRSAGQTQISISLEENIVAAIDAAAGREHRSRSNFIVHVILDYLERHGGGHSERGESSHITVIEEQPPEYKTQKKKTG